MLKRRFPFRIGTTSFILREDILPNVRYLKDYVDHVELLVFETDEQYGYPDRATVRELKAIAEDYDLTYSVHLPIGIKLGAKEDARRRKDVAAVLRAVDAMRDLNPLAWDLHLEENETGEPTGPAWAAACLQSLEELKCGGLDPLVTGVETLEFGFEESFPLVMAAGYGITLDIGHVWYRGLDEEIYLSQYLPHAVSIHLHGFDEVRDHKGLQHVPESRLIRFLNAVRMHPNVARLPVSIEVFGEEHFNASIKVLHEIA